MSWLRRSSGGGQPLRLDLRTIAPSAPMLLLHGIDGALTVDGTVTALECCAGDGEGVVQLFGQRKPGSPELPEWTRLAESLAD